MSERRMFSEPAFNLPQVVVSLSAFMVAIHVARVFILEPSANLHLLELFAFVPARYWPFPVAPYAGGLGADFWTPITYAFLHSSWVHLGVNLAWLLAFGSPVAERFGAWRFLVLSAVATVVGAGAHAATHLDQAVPLVGASAGISGMVAAAIRFVFAGGSLGRRSFRYTVRLPAPRIGELIRNRQVIYFTVLWFALNLLVGILPGLVGQPGVTIAWEAHTGGFIAGFLIFPLLDPIPRRPKEPKVPPGEA